jgi:hypothetical protein
VRRVAGSVVRQTAGTMLRAIAVPVTVFVVVTALAEALGAANLGTAATFGQIAFMLAVAGVIVRW